MLQQERMTVVDALVADIPTTDKGELRKYLYGLSNDELRKTAAAYQTVHSQVAADPRVIATQRQVLASAAKLWWSQLFRTVIDGRIAVDDQANRGMIERQIDEIRDEQMLKSLAPEHASQWFKKVLTENSALAKSLTWQSSKVLDPKWQKQAAAAQDQQDRETFSTAARKYGIGDTEANFALVRQVLGSGFSEHQIGEAVASGTVRVSPASPEQLAEWAQETYEARVDHLQNYASPEELREAARTETEQRRQEFQRAEQERSLAERAKADAAYGYPPLPEIHVPTGERIDAAWLNRISNTNLPLFKALLIKHGNFALTQRLKGLEV